ncbi:hypothetical protein QRX60_49930 [Amycolatopsis mongoliensis]|uniref:DUF2157 domain-containing protein n=1 Tax=Amycolatopsis mongoliensis TaxID=715475 RepID=A0A9Y2JR88_9PSEU|nr:DUF2157 domain-containing protein [Amycolatopsis sp. 4-36]WIY02032.1 hypothetical protein QRX60_49930 [Amycolatopsis sp. 4-36]
MAREPSVREVLDRLVGDSVLSPAQAGEVERALQAAAPRRLRIPWAEVAAYLGGGLVLVGAVLLVAASWRNWGEFARTFVTGATAVVLLTAGAVAAGPRSRSAARGRVAGALFALGAGAVAVTIAVALPDDIVTGAVACGAGLLTAVAGYLLVPSVPGLLASAGFLAATTLLSIDATVGVTPLNGGLGVGTGGLLVAALALGHVVPHRLLGLGAGLALAVFGFQQPLGEEGTAWVAYLLTFGLGVACLALVRRERTWVLLVAGVVAVTLAVPEAIWDLTGGAVGGALLVLTAGLVLLLVSFAGFRLRRTTGRKPPPASPGS